MVQQFRWLSPRETALLILRGWLGEPAGKAREAKLGLTEYQQHAVERLRAALQRRRGAILADAVGLGKTFVALSVIRTALAARARVLVVAPASLRAHWREHLARLGEHDVAFSTHTALSNGRLPAAEPDLIVIDEAHAFRNPKTRRYRSLQRVSSDAQVLLLTATPVNNSAEDLYHLIRIFARDDAFRDIGVADLNRAFRAQARTEVDRVLQDILVRRTRSQVRTERNLVFPDRKHPVAIRYDADWPVSVYEALESLTFAPYALESLAPAELMRLQLLKRLESSATAFRSSLRALRNVTELFLTGATRTSASQRGDDWVQLLLPIAFVGQEQSKRRLHLRHDALNDAELLRTCERALRGLPDNKLQQLLALLERECPGAKVLVFSQYADTAVYLWKQLHTRFRAGLVTGSDARLGANRAARGIVLDCFAPRANGRGTRLHERLQLDVLIATDVLSEGLNLQDANVVVNYEIAWNPVTLMQRIGRVDRLGSAHASVRVYNFIPERGLDRLLRLLERVETKLATIERLVGSDAPVLDAPQVGSARQAVEQSLRLPVEAEPVTLAPLREIESLRAELNGEPARIHDGPVAAALPGGRELLLLAVQWRRTVRLLIDDGNVVREDAAEAAALLRRALQVAAPSRAGEIDASRALAWLEAEELSSALRSAITSAPQRAATVKLIALARAQPVHQAARADRLLRVLARPLSVETQSRLALWSAASADAASACRELAGILRNEPSVERESPPDPRVLAVICVRQTTIVRDFAAPACPG
jgi:superfamily II DNA or RNA helicase